MEPEKHTDVPVDAISIPQVPVPHDAPDITDPG